MDKLEIEQLTELSDDGLIVRVLENKDIQNALMELLKYKTLEESEQLIKLDLPLGTLVYYIDWCKSSNMEGNYCSCECNESQRKECFDCECLLHTRVEPRRYTIHDSGKLGSELFSTYEEAKDWLVSYAKRKSKEI